MPDRLLERVKFSWHCLTTCLEGQPLVKTNVVCSLLSLKESCACRGTWQNIPNFRSLISFSRYICILISSLDNSWPMLSLEWHCFRAWAIVPSAPLLFFIWLCLTCELLLVDFLMMMLVMFNLSDCCTSPRKARQERQGLKGQLWD